MSHDIFQRLFLNFYSIVKLSTFLDKIAVSILTMITGIELDQYEEKLERGVAKELVLFHIRLTDFLTQNYFRASGRDRGNKIFAK